MADDGRERAVRDLTQRWLDATVRADADALDGMLADGYTFTHATTAITDTREEWLESFRSGRRRYKSWQISGVTIRLFGSAAIMTGRGHQEVVRDDGIFNLHTSFTNVWVEQDGAWKLAVWQATLVPGT
jgi:ketosteroid isomerase-like protein